MNAFIKRAPGHEGAILRVPETGRDLLTEGEVVRFSSYWNQRLRAGLVTVGRDRPSKEMSHEIVAEGKTLPKPEPKKRIKSSNKE